MGDGGRRTEDSQEVGWRRCGGPSWRLPPPPCNCNCNVVLLKGFLEYICFYCGVTNLAQTITAMVYIYWGVIQYHIYHRYRSTSSAKPFDFLPIEFGMPGARMISGTRAASSKFVNLCQRLPSPSLQEMKVTSATLCTVHRTTPSCWIGGIHHTHCQP